MARAHYVKQARKDYPEAGIKKGEAYYWWKFNFRRTVHRSKTPPKRQQLTTSGFLPQVWDVEDTLQSVDTGTEDFQSIVDEATGELENLRDECQEKLDNMPEPLQESSDSGQTLQNRVDSLESMISDLEGIDTDVDEEGIKQEVYTDVEDESKLSDEKKKELEEEFKERVEERKQEIIDELSNITYDGD